MYYVYALQSLKNNDIYIGYSSDLKKRIQQHNDLKVKSTKGYAPWKLVYYEAYKDKHDALLREKQLKQHQVKDELKKRLKYSLM